MDTTDRPTANLPARLAASPVRQPVQLSVAPREIEVAVSSSPINSRQLLRGLARNWWRILLLWLVVSLPLVSLIYKLVEPTYQAYSMLLIESNQPELFGPSLLTRDAGVGTPSYLQTQVTSITNDPVLDQAIAAPTISKLPMIKASTDPKTDLRKKLDVQIIPNTHWIKVALESTDQYEAAAIVNAVVDAFGEITKNFGAGEARGLKTDLEAYKKKLEVDIEKEKTVLRDLAKSGNVLFPKPRVGPKTDEPDQGPEPAFNNSLTLDQFRSTKDQLLQTEFQLVELEARFQARQAELQQAQARAAASDLPLASNDREKLKERVAEEFRHDPEVAALIDQIRSTTEELEHTKGIVKKGHDPARVEAQRHLTKLNKDYESLWESKSEQIYHRLLVTTGAPGAPEPDSLSELKSKIDELKIRKIKLTELVDKYDEKKQLSQTEAVDATFARDELTRLQNMHDQVDRKLEQLKFTQDKAAINIEDFNPAQVPKAQYNNKRMKYMLLLPVGALLALLGLFLLLEVKAERVADPDMLSSRVQSEVFALPPVPSSRPNRKLDGPGADDPIDRFMQRLDHLRFAVCGTQHDADLGRCVLITSAVGGEGKTFLSAQLAARCGNAGISTLLIDADLRRASLCPLLDIPEGLGLSDVLRNEAKFEDVKIPVQGGTFYLLAAGTPVQDTSRIFQRHDFAMLIAQLRQRYEMIIIDSPPVLPVPDALIMGQWTDGALLAARFDISRSPQVERARRQLDNAGIPLLGTVINGMRSSDSYYGRYSYGRQRASQPDPSSTA